MRHEAGRLHQGLPRTTFRNWGQSLDCGIYIATGTSTRVVQTAVTIEHAPQLVARSGGGIQQGQHLWAR
jgi:hypothetical protein